MGKEGHIWLGKEKWKYTGLPHMLTSNDLEKVVTCVSRLMWSDGPVLKKSPRIFVGMFDCNQAHS